MKTIFILVTLFAFLFPTALVIFWSKKTKCNYMPYIVGTLCFILFANVIEALVHTYVLTINQTTANFFNSNPLAYGIYGAIMAGLFEETGRLFGFKVLLKKYKTKEVSIGYGIGHGGIECVMTLGVTYLMYVIYMFNISLGDPSVDSLMAQTMSSIDLSLIPLAVIERICAMGVHIGLSVLVFIAANKQKKFYYYPLAILLHALVDIPAGLYQAGILTSLILIETIIAVISIIVLIIGIKKYKSIKE